MHHLSRFGVSLEEDLLAAFDLSIGEMGYQNRSEAIRDLIRKALLEEPNQHQGAQTAAGTIVMMYDHHIGDLPILLMELQHHYHHDIISTIHIHLNDDQCLEIIVVKGAIQRLRELANSIRTHKGVVYAELSVAHIEPSHEHTHPISRGGSS